MPKRVLDVGQCSLDHSTIRAYLDEHFDCEVVQTHAADDTVRELGRSRYDLVLINRKLDRNDSDGIDIVRQIKATDAIADVPVMLVTNYSEHQDAAVQEGAVYGFGKSQFGMPETLEKLSSVLK